MTIELWIPIDLTTEPQRKPGGEAALFSDAIWLPWEPDWPRGGYNTGEGWRSSSWFGMFSVKFRPWIYHSEHGWIYSESDEPHEFWFWSENVGWVWTSRAAYPAAYGLDLGAWLWYETGTTLPRWFYSFSSGQWMPI